MIKPPFTRTVKEIATQLNSDLDNGLDKDDYQKRIEKYGLNQIHQEGPKNKWSILADQLFDPIIYILSVAAILAFIFNDWLEGVAIIIVILISVFIGFYMEFQALRSLEALRKMGQTMIRVIRSGKSIRIKSSLLVPGDIIILQKGDVITADARVISQDNLSVKESTLTGESVPIFKKTEVLPKDTLIADQVNMLFKGTMVTTGSGKAIVVATGADTYLGKIQLMGMDAVETITPLEKKLNQLSKWLIWLTMIFALLIVIAGYIRGKDLLLMIETGVALAVAAIPEGLPIVATIALAKGMLRLSSKQVIIKRLEAVQTLGATTIICTDKTGTLTEDEMKVYTVLFPGGSITDVYQRKTDAFDFIEGKETFDMMMKAGVLCNNAATVVIAEDAESDSVEVALLDFARHAGFDPEAIRRENPEKLELPFDADRKFMATVHHNKQGFYVYVKGAFEKIIVDCDVILQDGKIQNFYQKKEWHKKMNDLGAQGLRTLAFAYKETKEPPVKENLTQNLVFLGIIGFMDPAREDVKSTIEIYKKASIKVIMATGDHPKTAQKIAELVGLLEQDALPTKVLQGKDLLHIKNANANLTRLLLDATVFARVTPEQKLDLVSFLQKNNHIVGMIGDGINDVPALKRADIGIAMGIRGTEAAREVADVILRNDKFTAVELAIRQGRVIFQNIRQFVVYLLSCNLAEILSVGVAALVNLPSPLLPLQILFLNLVTDVFPALALGLGKGEEDSMRQPPRNPKEPIMTRKDWYATIAYGLSISIAVLGIVIYSDFVLKLPSESINNMAFYTLVLAQLFNVFNIPKRSESFFINEVTKNPWVWGAIALSLGITAAAYLVPPIARVLQLHTLSVYHMGLTVVFATGSLVLVQLVKRIVITS